MLGIPPENHRFDEQPFVGEWEDVGIFRSHFVAVPVVVNGFGQPIHVLCDWEYRETEV